MVIKMQDEWGTIGVKKALPFTKFLNYKLNKLRGSGVLQNILTIPTQNCPLNENPMPITFHKMVFLFTVFVLGGILSIIIFIFERAASYKKDGMLEKIDGRVIGSRGPSRAMAPQHFGKIEKRSNAETEIDKLSVVVPLELKSTLRHWMESNATLSKEEFLKLIKLEVGAIFVDQLVRGEQRKEKM